MIEAPRVRIREERLKQLLEGINQFGRNPSTGGFNRMGFSKADMAARDWLAEVMAVEGLSVHRDAAANVFGRYGPPAGSCVMVGSHLDTVREGGALDGALGVAAGLECVLALRDAGISLDHPVEVVATSEEEGRFGGMLGSQAIVGDLDPQWLQQATAADGLRLADAMRAQGLDPSLLPTAQRAKGNIKAFLELHIEQGPILEASGLSIGVADRISGVVNWSVKLRGAANHSGTTPMNLRADAFAGLAEVSVAIPKIIRRVGTEYSRVTIGKVDVEPNFPHTIPGTANFSLVIRDNHASAMDALCVALRDQIHATCHAHGLTYTLIEHSRLPPVELDPALAQLLLEEARALGVPHQVMPSGAGHDAQTMQALCPAGLIFVPSRGGISHAPEEWTDWSDIYAGAQLLLNSVLRLAIPSRQ